MKLENVRVFNDVIKQVLREKLRLGAAEAPKYINHVKEEVKGKVTEVNSWYTRILGLDEVKLYQERVVAQQEKLLNVQDKRRSISHELTEIRKKSNELQDQIHKIKRQDDLQGFLELMRQETEVLKIERDITNNFHECDREEREVFTAFTNAVRDSHEKQRAQLEYTKYFGLVLSLVGSFLTFCYSTLRKQDLKRFIEDHMMSMTGSSKPLIEQLQENQKQLGEVIEEIDKGSPEILRLINKNHEEIIRALREPHDKIMGTISQNHQEVTNMLFSLPTSSGNSKFSFKDTNRNKSNNVLDNQKIILYSCAAFIGFVIIRTIIN